MNLDFDASGAVVLLVVVVMEEEVDVEEKEEDEEDSGRFLLLAVVEDEDEDDDDDDVESFRSRFLLALVLIFVQLGIDRGDFDRAQWARWSMKNEATRRCWQDVGPPQKLKTEQTKSI
jgi:hypothetical protein